MTRKKILGIAILSLLAAALSLHAATFSTATAAGKWGFVTNGSVGGIGPVGAVGRFSQAVTGNISGIQTRSLNGSIADEALTGNVSVSADCTGTATINVFASGTLVRITTPRNCLGQQHA